METEGKMGKLFLCKIRLSENSGRKTGLAAVVS